MTEPSQPSVAWTPLLEGEDAERALAAVRAVTRSLAEPPPPPPAGGGEPFASELSRPSVSSGLAGHAFSYAHLDRCFPGEGFADRALENLVEAIEAVGSGDSVPDLYAGFTGVAWAVEQLRGHLLEDDDEDDPNEGIDEALLEHLGQSPWRRDFDLTSGLTGFGLYALSRLPRPAAAECLERVVDRLAETAVERAEGLAWHTDATRLWDDEARGLYPNGYDNLGVAHGVPGPVAVLARIRAAGVNEAKADRLLEGAVDWVLAQKLPEGGDSVFPYAVGQGAPRRPARTAWCYGDPGVAAALLVAARATGNSAWEDEAVALARIAARRPEGSTGVRDCGLCHGGAGLAHLFNRMYQATGEEELALAARRWYRWTLGRRRQGEGYGGFISWGPNADGEMGWSADPTFLTGAAGIALAFVAAATPVEPRWDELLLVSPLTPSNPKRSEESEPPL